MAPAAGLSTWIARRTRASSARWRGGLEEAWEGGGFSGLKPSHDRAETTRLCRLCGAGQPQAGCVAGDEAAVCRVAAGCNPAASLVCCYDRAVVWRVVSMLEYGSEEISDCPTSIVRGFRCFPAQVPGFRCVVAPKPGDGVTARSTSGSGITSGSPALPNVQYHDARRGAADAGAGAHADERAPGWPIHVCRHAIGQGRSDGTDLLPSGHVSGRAGGQVSYERAVRKRRLAAGARPER